VVGFRRNSGFAGFLLLSGRTDNAPFTAPQLRFAESLGSHLGRTLDSLERIERLLEISREMERDAQEAAVLLRARGFLAPPERPEVPGVEYAWELWRGQFPGNSMFDAVALPNRSLGLVLADAEGSGLEAAIRLIQLQALLRSRFWAYSDDLRELLESTERALLAARNESRPLRLFCARYRPLTRTLHFVNAGYYPPMLLRVHSQGAEILRLASRGGAICDPARTELIEEEIPLGPGDLLAIASPGVAAARSPGKELWGESRLADTLLSWEGQPLQDMARLTLRTVEEFSGQDPTLPPRSLILLRQHSPHFSEAPVSGGTPPTG
jgi:sigma-B regulation protein RsbU (phosphoserine phosphatase)